ncbi:hypothetical protein HOH67_01270 [Candidatus Peregrinibacteria bacterium]|jgi:hypothetical protein|nr:hypothetical protein [Candidatus Peregrinibacteria bacterium]MBT5823738.1 hypothetical protein [Candidatus Peregrinibacteria bacterium]
MGPKRRPEATARDNERREMREMKTPEEKKAARKRTTKLGKRVVKLNQEREEREAENTIAANETLEADLAKIENKLEERVDKRGVVVGENLTKKDVQLKIKEEALVDLDKKITEVNESTSLTKKKRLKTLEARKAELEKEIIAINTELPDEEDDKAKEKEEDAPTEEDAEDKRADPEETTEGGPEIPRGFSQVALRLAKSLLAEPMNEDDPPVTKVKKQFAFGALKVISSFVGTDWIKGLSTDPNEAKRKAEIDSALDDLEAGYAMKVIDRAAIYSDDPNVFIKVEWGEAEKTANIYPHNVSNIMRRTLGVGNIDENLKKLGIDVNEEDKKWTVEAMQKAIKGNRSQPAKNLAVLLKIIEKSRQGSKTAEFFPWLKSNAISVTRQLGKKHKGFEGYMEAVEEAEVPSDVLIYDYPEALKNDEYHALVEARNAWMNDPENTVLAEKGVDAMYTYLKSIEEKFVGTNLVPAAATNWSNLAIASKFKKMDGYKKFVKSVDQKAQELFDENEYKFIRDLDPFMKLVYIGAKNSGEGDKDRFEVQWRTDKDGKKYQRPYIIGDMYEEDFASQGLEAVAAQEGVELPADLTGEELEEYLDKARDIIPVQSEHEYKFKKDTNYKDVLEELRKDYKKTGKDKRHPFVSFMDDAKPNKDTLKKQLEAQAVYFTGVTGLPDQIQAAFEAINNGDEPGNLYEILADYSMIRTDMLARMEKVTFYKQLEVNGDRDSDFVKSMMDVAEYNSAD